LYSCVTFRNPRWEYLPRTRGPVAIAGDLRSAVAKR
jgi:hypothetical protein